MSDLYTPTYTGDASQDRENQFIAQAINQVNQIPVWNNMPERFPYGMIFATEAGAWDPGSGPGIYYGGYDGVYKRMDISGDTLLGVYDQVTDTPTLDCNPAPGTIFPGDYYILEVNGVFSSACANVSGKTGSIGDLLIWTGTAWETLDEGANYLSSVTADAAEGHITLNAGGTSNVPPTLPAHIARKFEIDAVKNGSDAADQMQDSRLDSLEAWDVDHVDPIGNPHGMVRYRGEWAEGEYKEFDEVTADGWLMGANQDTTEPAAPRAAGLFEWRWYSTDAPVWDPRTTPAVQLFTGVRSVAPAALMIDSLRVWIPLIDPGITYSIMVDIPDDDGLPAYIQIFPTTTGWFYVTNIGKFVKAGQAIDFYLVTQGAGSTFTDFSSEWDYRKRSNTPNPDAPIPQSQFRWHNGSYPDVIYWNVWDQNLVDFTSEIGALKAGDLIRIMYSEPGSPEFIEWNLTDDALLLTNPDPTLNMYDIRVSPIQTEILAEKGWHTVIGRHYESSPMEYVQETGKWLGSTENRGLYSVTGASAVQETDDGYGIDVYVQQWTKSDHWDVKAATMIQGPSSESRLAMIEQRLADLEALG